MSDLLLGRIPGGMIPPTGQEAVAIGVVAASKKGDVMSGAHRSHHHTHWPRGLSLDAIMAELFGKATGVVGGRSGSMHLYDVSAGFFGGNGIVGAGLGLAPLVRIGRRLRNDASVAVGFIGDGGLNTGRTWEVLSTFGGRWSRLPLVLSMREQPLRGGNSHHLGNGGWLSDQEGRGFGVEAVSVDGQNVLEVFSATKAARDRAVREMVIGFVSRHEHIDTEGTGLTGLPTPHGGGSSGLAIVRDPIDRLAATLIAENVITSEEIAGFSTEIAAAIPAAIGFARRVSLIGPLRSNRSELGVPGSAGWHLALRERCTGSEEKVWS